MKKRKRKIGRGCWRPSCEHCLRTFEKIRKNEGKKETRQGNKREKRNRKYIERVVRRPSCEHCLILGNKKKRKKSDKKKRNKRKKKRKKSAYIIWCHFPSTIPINASLNSLICSSINTTYFHFIFSTGKPANEKKGRKTKNEQKKKRTEKHRH